jgi:hypothetical protein
MPRYGEAAQKSVERTMRKRKHGTLKSGGSGKKVTSREQAIAIGLEEARKKGAKVPSRGRGRSTSSSKTGARRSTRGRTNRTRASSSRRGMH